MVDGHIVAFLLNLCKLSWWLRYRPSLLLLVFSFALVKAVSCLCRHRWFYNCVEPNGREQREDGTAETQRIRPNSNLLCSASIMVFAPFFCEAYSTPLAGPHLTTQQSETQQGMATRSHMPCVRRWPMVRLPGMSPPTPECLAHLLGQQSD